MSKPIGQATPTVEELEAENNLLKNTIDYLQDELTEAYNQLAEKHGGIKEERDKLKLAIHRIHKHLEGIAEYECSDDMWSIFLAIDEEVEDVLNESSAT